MTVAQLSKVRLEYFQHGEGPEKLVFIHGFEASARIWGQVQEALPADRYTSIAINNRGAGGSEAPPNEADYGVQIFAEDAFELVSSVGWRDFTLVGHSLGGATVAQFAVDHPQLIKGLVLLDPSDPDGYRAGLPTEGPELDALIDRRMAARRPSAVPPESARQLHPSVRQLLADIAAAPERRLRGSMRSMMGLRLGERVAGLPMPVLVAFGDKDTTIPVTAMLATWAKYPKGTGLHVWHGAGHSPNLDCPADVAAALRRFVEKTISARAKAAAA
ncbi:MAG TPA: alpha/beta hydrolase [Caulobacteraceae bacterium]|jgi:branched-chain amino acid transport system permease protein|nr:alpha/beta hydrolase [Caulobacteraceae bacterium]